jgi:hydrogenase maturation protein HypF
MIEALVDDVRAGLPPGVLAARFHNGLAASIVKIAEEVAQPRIALTGGCFQNVYLTHRTREQLEAARFEVLLHRRVPANDGGIALGQLVVAAAQLDHDLAPRGRGSEGS